MVGRRTYRACYIGTPLYICGFVVLGAAFQKHLSVGALVLGWGTSAVGTMVNTVAVCEFLHLRLFRDDIKALRRRCLRQ